jgi:Zn-dependent protease with chaperone function
VRSSKGSAWSYNKLITENQVPVLVAIAFGVLVLAPGVYARWSSRHLLRHLEDPLLPDRLVEHSRRVGTAAGIVIGLGAVLLGPFLPALLFLTWVSVLAGGFRARKAIFDESRGISSYLAHTLRFWLGLVGSFALIASIPWAMAISRDDALEVGIALGAAAWLWVLSGPVVFRRLVRSRPFDGPEAEALSPLFSRILAKARCGAPALFVAEARGGSWVNAFALPAVRRPGVLFTRGFLDALTPEETAAIFAHEVAHLEHFQPGKVLLGRALALVLVVLPIFLWAGPLSDLLRGWEWIWPLAFLIAFAARAGKSRGHEAESDRRALELSVDPDALVSGLTKLHSLNRLSRRWDAAYESLSTHPSLAGRIRAIRAVSGPRIPEGLEASFRAADGSDRAVLFDASRIHWLRGLPEDGKNLLARSGSRQSHRYEDLLELRLRGGRELVMKGKAGETGRMTVGAEDVAAIEEVLDRVDGLLSEAPAGTAPTGRIWSLVLGLLGLFPTVSWVVAALAATALARPSFATLLALGASALASAIAVHDPSRPSGSRWLSSCIALAGVACLVVAARRRGVPRSRSEALLATLVPLGLVVLSGFGAATAFVSSLPAMHLSLWASESPTAFVGLVAIGAVLASLPRTRARIGAALALAGALAVAFIGSSAFRERFGGDLFAASGAPIPERDAFLTRIREVTIPGGASRLWLSPRGASFAVALVPPDEEEDDFAYLVETAPGRLGSVRARAFEYLDDERILVLERKEGRAVLKALMVSDLESEVVVQEMPLLAGADLAADASGNWQVTGYDWVEGKLLLIRGSLGGGVPEEVRFPIDDDLPTMISVNREGVALLARYEVPGAELLVPASSPRLVMALELSEPGGAGVSLGSPLSRRSATARRSRPRFYCAATSRQDGYFRSLPILFVRDLRFFPGRSMETRSEARRGSHEPLGRVAGPGETSVAKSPFVPTCEEPFSPGRGTSSRRPG